MKIIILFLMILTGSFLGSLILAKVYLISKSEKGLGVESFESKLSLLRNSGKVETVFLGTSTVQNHINTKWQKENGLVSFNMGLPGVYWNEYPFILKQLLKERFNTLVLQLSVKNFLNPIDCPRLYFENIYFRIKRQSDWNCLKNLSLNQFLPYLNQIPYLKIEKKDLSKEDLANHYGREVNYLRGDQKRWVAFYKNGDGQVFSNFSLPTATYEIKKLKVDNIAEEYFDYLRDLVSLVHKHGKEIIIVFEPRHFDNQIRFDVEKFKNRLKVVVPIIFNNEIRVKPNGYSDPAHFKPLKSLQYTKLLSCQLKKIIGERVVCDKLKKNLEFDG